MINVALSRPLIDALLFCLAIAIGITPQLLPAIVSRQPSTGSRALARKRVLVKRLVTIEDLGNIEVLFTDKTGTLTEGKISFQDALDPAGDRATQPLLLGLLCNEATMTADGPVGGNALDQALSGAPAAPGRCPDCSPAIGGWARCRSTTSASSPPCSCGAPGGATTARHQGRTGGGPRSLRRRSERSRGGARGSCSPTARGSWPSPPARRPRSRWATSTTCGWPAF